MYEVEDRGYDTPCWVWQRSKTKNGYGNLWHPVEKRTVYAHRFHYEQKHGTVEGRLQLDHLCRVRLCVNPDHLEPVTQRTNLLRGEGFSAVNAAKTHCLRGHEFTPDNIRWQNGGRWRACKTCEAEARRRLLQLKSSQT